jgi:sugar lactone lactonase YvrE
MVDQRVVRVENGVATTFADISPFCGFWANDMVVSESDVAYVGNFGFDLDVMLRDIGAAGMLASPPPSTHLVVLGPDGTILQTIDDMHFPNGSVITPDGQTLIVAETMTFRLTAFSINADGTLRDRRVFAQLDFVAADGICLDAEGQVWVANALAPEVLRVADGGEITEKVTTTQNCFACMLGGGDGQTLFAMTAPSSDRFAIADRRDGCIESVRVEIPGAGRP